MPVRKILQFVCPLISVICVATGYARFGAWAAGLAGGVALAAWLGAARWPFGFLSWSALVLSTGLAAAGLLLGALPLWMLLAGVFALAGWDVLVWEHASIKDPLAAGLAPTDAKHYESLALALGLGLLAILAGRWFHFQVPFGWMVVLVILVLFSLERVRHTLTG